MKTYLKEHQEEALKKIACAMGKDAFIGKDCVCYAPERFNPLANAEQWIECLMYAHQFCSGSGQFIEIDLNSAVESRESLLIAVLELIE